jgi:hypothetical protein
MAREKVQSINVDTADDSVIFRFENLVGLVVLRRERETSRFRNIGLGGSEPERIDAGILIDFKRTGRATEGRPKQCCTDCRATPSG